MLRAVYQHILDYDRLSPALPVIDVAQPDTQKDVLPGLRFLRDEVKRESDSPASSSSNAPYLGAVWDELVHACQPVAIYRMFPLANRAIKVDVVAEDGARWVRVNTVKNARLTMEFREIDSYLTSDEDETTPRLAQTELDNSVLRMGRELLAATKANPISITTPFSSTSTVVTPQVTMRLTRLDPSKDDIDPRIGKTIQRLRDMGIDVQLGERSPTPVAKTLTAPKLPEPTTNINLDLSALIALISDISHSPPPQTEQEAHARFDPPQSYLDWKKERIKSLVRRNQDIHDVDDDGGIWENSRQHYRALATQAIQEMNKGILQEIRDRISTHLDIAFWTTGEARHRCLQIVSKIGGEKERLRADALLCSSLCAQLLPIPSPPHIHTNGVAGTSGTDDESMRTPLDTYWEHSRYPAGFLPLVPVRVYPSTLPTAEDDSRSSIFFDTLAQTCTGILSHTAIPISQVASPPMTEYVLEEIPPAVQTSLSKLTVHTVTSMLAGASRAYTTLTTNRSSVKAVVKEMRKISGRGRYEPGPEMGEVEKVALWVLDPRSLSEGMRSQ